MTTGILYLFLCIKYCRWWIDGCCFVASLIHRVASLRFVWDLFCLPRWDRLLSARIVGFSWWYGYGLNHFTFYVSHRVIIAFKITRTWRWSWIQYLKIVIATVEGSTQKDIDYFVLFFFCLRCIYVGNACQLANNKLPKGKTFKRYYTYMLLCLKSISVALAIVFKCLNFFANSILSF